MPWSVQDLPPSAAGLTGSAAVRFIAAANSALEQDPADEGSAIAIGLAAAQKGDSMRKLRIDRIGTVFTGEAPPGGGIRARVDEATGFLHVPRSHIARTGPLVYGDGEREWTEFRGDDALFSARALDSFSSLILTNEHPPELVTTANAKRLQVGHTSRASRDGAFLDTDDIVITDRTAIKRAQQDGGVEVSIGFLCDVIRQDGVAPDGTPFEFIQDNLEGNHLALTDIGRAGPECRLAMDSAITTTALVGSAEPTTITTEPLTPKADVAEETPMSEAKKPDAEIEVEGKKPEAKIEPKQDSAPAPTPPKPAPELKVDHAALVRERVAVTHAAETILGRRDDSADNETLMMAVVAKVDGDDAIKDAAGWSTDYTRARFDAAIVAHEKSQRVDTARQIAGYVDRPFLVDGKSGQDSIDLDAELDKLNNYYRDAWKTPVAQGEAS